MISLATTSQTAAAVDNIELTQLHPAPANGPTVVAPRLGLFAGVKAQVSVVAGTASASIGELLSIREGTVLPLDREFDAPFDVMLDGKVLARGELVAVDGHFGIRITEVRETALP